MICINCFHIKTSVINSRVQAKDSSVWRRRQCQNCKKVFTTYEKPSANDQTVLYNDNTTLPFNIGKLTVSIARSFQHDKKQADYSSYALAQTVETKLIKRQKSISVDDITAITHATLKKYDQLAAMQYAAQHGLVTIKRRPGRPSTTYL